MPTQVSDYSRFVLGDMVAIYQKDPANKIGLLLLPLEKESQRVVKRIDLTAEIGIRKMMRERMNQSTAWGIDPLAQVKWAGDPVSAFAQGRTMRNSPATQSLDLVDQTSSTTGGVTTILTTLRSPEGYRVEHRLSWRAGEQAIEVTTTFVNPTDKPATLEALASFSLMGISPFAYDDAPERLRMHRFRSAWSAEGRHECRNLEDIGLEPSWAGHGVRSERFGQLGSLPVNGFFPTLGVEDAAAGVVWAAQLAWAGSWQMEVYRKDDCVAMSGGLADREFGHWQKHVAPGASFTGPTAIVTVASGDITAACQRLTAMQHRPLDAADAPKNEADLPVIFNEWCTSWGKPTHDNLVALADRLAGSGVKYLVIDAGWYMPEGSGWWQAQGDWIPNATMFPHGLDAACADIRKRGLVPGLWFEFEVVSQDAKAVTQNDHLLKRDGRVINSGGRRFWDMNDPWVVEYLSERVIGLIRRCGVGYMKIDYNENIGVGCDGAESEGEGLRRHIEGVYAFLRKVRTELPDLVIEACSSGGHRLEPSMLALTAMGSFSDAHETQDIPVIAANLHQLILPRQSQIWAVLHGSDDERRLIYLLTSTFLGRMCLSGGVDQLSPAQWATVVRAVAFYGQCAGVIRRGHSRVTSAHSRAHRHLRGWQGVVRTSDDGCEALVVVHTFAGEQGGEVTLTLPPHTASAGRWRIVGSLAEQGAQPRVVGSTVIVPAAGEWCGAAVLLRRDASIRQIPSVS